MPYFLSQSSGSMPIEPSPSVTIVSPRRAAARRSGRLTLWPPKSTWPPSSNQSMPVVTASLNSPAGRISFPSASTRQPAWTRSRVTCASRLAGSSIVPGSSRGSFASRKPSSKSRMSAAASVAGSRRIDQAELGRDGQRRGPAGRDHGAVVVELQLGEELVGRRRPSSAGGCAGSGRAGAVVSISSSRSDSTSSAGRRGPRPGCGRASCPAAARRRRSPSRGGAGRSRA